MNWGWGGSWSLEGAWEKGVLLWGLDWKGIALFLGAAVFLVTRVFQTRCPKCGAFFAAMERDWREVSRSHVSREYDRVDLAVRCECASCRHEWVIERSHKTRRTYHSGL